MKTEEYIEEFIHELSKYLSGGDPRGDWIVDENLQRLGKVIWATAYQDGFDAGAEYAIMKERG